MFYSLLIKLLWGKSKPVREKIQFTKNIFSNNLSDPLLSTSKSMTRWVRSAPSWEWRYAEKLVILKCSAIWSKWIWSCMRWRNRVIHRINISLKVREDFMSWVLVPTNHQSYVWKWIPFIDKNWHKDKEPSLAPSIYSQTDRINSSILTG